eukprot:13481-Heterococcus_DN1.PRE.3
MMQHIATIQQQCSSTANRKFESLAKAQCYCCYCCCQFVPSSKKVNATKDTLRTPGQQALQSNVTAFYMRRPSVTTESTAVQRQRAAAHCKHLADANSAYTLHSTATAAATTTAATVVAAAVASAAAAAAAAAAVVTVVNAVFVAVQPVCTAV